MHIVADSWGGKEQYSQCTIVGFNATVFAQLIDMVLDSISQLTFPRVAFVEFWCSIKESSPSDQKSPLQSCSLFSNYIFEAEFSSHTSTKTTKRTDWKQKQTWGSSSLPLIQTFREPGKIQRNGCCSAHCDFCFGRIHLFFLKCEIYTDL